MRELHLLDIVLAGIQVGECIDPRPCVVIEVHSSSCVLVLPCSSQLDLARDEYFNIPDTSPEFKATGLKRSSYVINLAPAIVTTDLVRKRLGRLEGSLAADFLTWVRTALQG